MREELVRRAQAGDVAAFSALTESVIDTVFATARLVLRDDEAAADTVQDALFKAWLDIRALRDPERFDAWLHRIVIRMCYRSARLGRRRRVVELDLSGAVEPITADPTPALAVRDQLERGFRHLSTDQRAVIVLRYYHDLPMQTCAEILGVPLGTVQSRLNRAVQAMRAALDADERRAGIAAEVTR